MTLFNADELLAAAAAATGLDDFGPADFMQPFRILIDGLNTDAGIAPARADRLRARLLRLLMNRLWLARDVAEHPDILAEDLGTVVAIVSLPRTGSTKLHRLLGASGDFQVVPFWKAHMPSRIPGEPDAGAARRIAATREHEEWMYRTSPAILTGHPQFTMEAEEDQWLMEHSFGHAIMFGMFDSAVFMQWLMRADPTPSFDYLLTQLKYLQWQFPADRGKPWLVKSPTHLGSEHQLRRLFADLRLVITHRDPAQCMTSITATAAAARLLYSDRPSGTMAGDVSAMFSQLADAHVGWRDQAQAPVLDLAFGDITADGMAAARRVYDFLGMRLSSESLDRMLAWDRANQRGKHGRLAYSAEAYGTTNAAIRQHFAAYIGRFAAYLA